MEETKGGALCYVLGFCLRESDKSQRNKATFDTCGTASTVMMPISMIITVGRRSTVGLLPCSPWKMCFASCPIREKHRKFSARGTVLSMIHAHLEALNPWPVRVCFTRTLR
ncbi:conserved hypothetical protein [Coccidioides posadasii str. Silveira]|uniref:Uncharacterized protein n=1 Tax=Coccidioides posadasii (strain RMSCC 757 / Silveira) TaxID=443226 RepID=E9DCV8_COCPS|nr:conserved hypothetical protein [Coccidioides posadasii str. Silveira]